MTPSGYLFMAIGWTIVLSLTTFALYRLLKRRSR